MSIFKRFLLRTLTTSVLMLAAIAPVLAGDLIGRLTGKPGSQVNVYAQPSTQSNSPHYGLVGDVVSVVQTTQAEDGYTWHLVRFKSEAQGWVRGDQIRMVSY